MTHDDLDTLLDTLPSCEAAEPFDRLATLTSAPDRTAEELQRIFAAVNSLFPKDHEQYSLPFHLPRTDGVMEAVARHPNTPPAVLAKVLFHAPDAFCSNPVASLLTLENPEWTKQVSDAGLCRLLNRPNAPTSIVAAIAAGHVTDELMKNRWWAVDGLSTRYQLLLQQVRRLTPSIADINIDEDGPIPRRVREARDHIAIAPEIETVEEWSRAVRECLTVAWISSNSRQTGGDRESWELRYYYDLRRGRRLRRFSPPPSNEPWGSWWFRLGAAEEARPLVGRLWSPSVKQMLQELSQDSHCLVRAAARFRLAEPNRNFPTVSH